MFKTKQKISSVIVACLTLFVSVLLAVMTLVMPANVTASAAEPQTETLSVLATTGTLSSDSSTITWTGTNVAFSNKKSSTAIRTSDSAHYRVYANSTVTVSTTNSASITQIVITATSSSYATVCQTSINNTYSGAATVSDSVVTATFSNAASITFTASAQWRLSKIAVTYVEASSEPACEHVNQTTTTTDATCTVVGSTVVTCNDCGETVSTTEIPATGHVNTTETTTDATCTEAGSTVVTCDKCRETVSTTEIPALGHDIAEGEPVNNENGTHSVTGTCSRCGEEETVEIECTLVKTENEDTNTYTCSECGYTYDAIKYTVTYSVPSGVAAVELVKVEANTTTTLEIAENYDKYTFVGWMTTEYAQSTDMPDYLEAGTDYTVTQDITLYAVYTYSEGSGAWTLVTDVNALSNGNQIVIVASGFDYALGTTQNSNNRATVAVAKGDKTVEISESVQIITLEEGTVDGTYAFNVSAGYLYAASSSSNYLRTQVTNDANGSWTIEITDAGVATIKAQGDNTRNWLRFNNSNSPKIFSCYGSGQNDVSIYKKDGNTFYTTSFSGCAHTATTEETTDATCTETGLTKVICTACNAVLEETELPALGHNYVDNFCSVCGEQDPETIDYSGYYYISFTHSETVYYADNSQLSSNRYFARTEAPEAETVAVNYLYRLEKTAVGIYTIYEFDGDCYQENVTVEKVGDVYRFYATVDGDECQFLLNAGSTNKYVKFYKASNATNSSYAQDITLTPVELSANIDRATITLGDDITLNYYVAMSAAFEGAKMYFTVGESSDAIEVACVLVGTEYKFSLNVPPHYMTTNVKAVLKFNDIELDIIENYSIQTYANNQLNDSPSDELKQLLIDLLYYGAAAQNYKGQNTENLANAGIENTNTAAPTATDFTLEKNEEIDSYPAYFMGAGVYFDNVNKIFVKLNTTENVTLTINGVEVAVTGSYVYTDGILATGFADTYTFVLSCNGVVMQTLTYSVNAYAYAKQSDATMGELALALYRYGESAKAYKA